MPLATPVSRTGHTTTSLTHHSHFTCIGSPLLRLCFLREPSPADGSQLRLPRAQKGESLITAKWQTPHCCRCHPHHFTISPFHPSSLFSLDLSTSTSLPLACRLVPQDYVRLLPQKEQAPEPPAVQREAAQPAAVRDSEHHDNTEGRQGVYGATNTTLVSGGPICGSCCFLMVAHACCWAVFRAAA